MCGARGEGDRGCSQMKAKFSRLVRNVQCERTHFGLQAIHKDFLSPLLVTESVVA